MFATRHAPLRLLLVFALLFTSFGFPAAVFAQDNAADSLVVSFPGNYGQAIGAPSWDPADAAVAASDEDGDGIYTLSVTLPRGDFEFKVAFDGDWPGNLGLNAVEEGENIPFSVSEESEVIFFFEPDNNAITVTVAGIPVVADGAPVGEEEEQVAATGDSAINTDALYHDSRSDEFRNPGGAQPTGAEVVLRLRTAANDVTEVRLLLDELTAGASQALPMTTVASDATSTWWEATFATGETPGVFNYKFQISDGDTTLYYTDGGDLTGGAGQTSTARPAMWDGWDIYVYAADFAAPAWASNAVIYQIFPDRFRNGDPSNDPTSDDFGYPEERGQAFPITPWNTIVPDPDPQDPALNPEWYATWNSTFYGGDLQGVREKLDYLQELGINTIYFTPIHEAATNHRYDSRDPRLVDDNLAVLGDFDASMAYFTDFAAEVKERGMHLILDGVPNHTSSDSAFFDRYGNWDTVGACEDVESEYRDYYLFTDAADPAEAACAGGQNYRGFAGILTLPQQDTAGESVMEDWLDPESGVAAYWVLIPGVDGWRIDTVADVSAINPTFFRPFREVTKAANPEVLLISETWRESDVYSHVLGNEFDSTMNYRFANAVLGFLRDSTFTETGDGEIAPLSAEEFEATLRAIEEDYPPAAFATAMNLLSSHDINRAVRVLDHDGVDYATVEPNNGFIDGRNRLRLASAIQFTMPGAPTIFYGDEVGLVGFGKDPMRDDPHNRQPYPWEDEEGYESLPEWRKVDGELLAHYQRLGALRAEYAFLSTGEWVTLLVEDGVLVYGRRDESGAAIIAVNRSDSDFDTQLNTAGFAPLGGEFVDAFGSETIASDDESGALEISVPSMDFRIWIHDGPIVTPATPTFEALPGEGAVGMMASGEAEEGDTVIFYRSRVDGGYQPIAQGEFADETSNIDTDAVNGTAYFYRAVVVNAAGIPSAPSEAVRVVPSAMIESATLVGPLEITHTVSAITATEQISAVVFAPGATDAEGPATGLIAELGSVFLSDTGMAMFQWQPAEFLGDTPEGDLYGGTLLPSLSGDYSYRFRFSSDLGETWTETESGAMTVLPSEDTEAPKPPFRMDEIARSAQSVTFAWRFSRPRDLAHISICRTDLTAEEEEECAVQFTAPAASNVFTDTLVTTGHTYRYTVQVVDQSFNVSEPSDPIELTAELTTALTTFRVRVPAETPPGEMVYIAGDNPDVFGAPWDPAHMPMTDMGDGIWEWQVELLDGQVLQYKYARGSWERSEQWGTISGMANRRVQIVRLEDGTALVDNTSTDWESDAPDDTLAVQAWRDPLVRETVPAADSSGAVDFVQATLSIAVIVDDPNAVIVVTDEAGETVSGSVTVDAPETFTWTPDAPLEAGTYTATVFNVEATIGMLKPYVWSFSVE